MGYGEVGGDGSVEWNVVSQHGGPSLQNSDPIPFADIGNGKGRPGKFRVEMRFDGITMQQAQGIVSAAGNAGIDADIQPNGSAGVILRFWVPAIYRQPPTPPQPWPNRPWEVRVEW